MSLPSDGSCASLRYGAREGLFFTCAGKGRFNPADVFEEGVAYGGEGRFFEWFVYVVILLSLE